MAINKVGSKGIVDCSVAAADFAPGTVTSVKLADDAVTNAKLSNSSITAGGTSVALGASITLNNQLIDWQSVITGNTTMVSGRGYFVNTTGGAVSMTLPAAASIGNFVVIKDYAGTFATNNLTILRNSHKIQGVANDSKLSTNRASVILIYVDATKGWLFTDEHNVGDLEKNLFISATGGTITTSGDFKIHSFTGDGNFVVSQVGAGSGPSVVDYLVVAGGGGGTATSGGGGGGAGGLRESHSTPVSGSYTASPLATPTGITLTAQTYPISVGAGGASVGGGSGCANAAATNGGNGSNSVFSTITSAGAGGAGKNGTAGTNGGSGGGGGGGGSSNCGGSGNTPPVSPPQGNNGGKGSPGTGGKDAGGGGGGAGAVGTSRPNNGAGGPGGNGVATEITGSSVTRAGGGGGGTRPCGPSPGSPGPGSGGSGGGGAGASGSNPSAGVAGTANTGSGGGGGSRGQPGVYYWPAGAGGKGIVIIRYKFQ